MTKLKKVLTLHDLVFAGLSSTIGVGIFVIISNIVQKSGNYAWISIIIAGLLTLFTVFSYAELASIYNSNSSEYEYIKEVSNHKVASFLELL